MIPEALKYTESHEWVSIAGDTATVGITDFAQSQLGDITYVELPQRGKAVKAGGSVAVVESVKAASDIYAPVAGTISAANEDLEGCPEKVNKSPYQEGWIFRLSGVKSVEVDQLMNAKQYQDFLENGAH